MLYLILAGLLFAFAAPLINRWLGRYAVVPVSMVPLIFFGYFSLYLPAVLGGETILQSYTWVPVLGIDLQFRLDGLSLFFSLMITIFGFLIFFYASGYLKENRQIGRFYFYLMLFMTAMLGVVTADNIFCLFVFWELTSISSYLLISFDHEKAASRASAWQALLVTGFGGLALMAGLILLSMAGKSHTFTGLFESGSPIAIHNFYVPALVLICLGCFTKSAQFPFHFWLPNAMAAPTPVSAYLHSATMVKAGIYLLARLTPVMGGTEVWQYTLMMVGGVTALVGAVLALQHTDLKAILAYTTISALGLMVGMIGVGTAIALKAMLVFLLAHALYKGTMFLVAGAIDHSTGTREYYSLQGLVWRMPLTATAAALAALSMAGLMPFFGFIGKELLYEAALGATLYASLAFGFTFLTGTVFVAIALLLSYGIFWYKRHTPTPVKHPPIPSLTLPPLVLGLAGLALGLTPSVLAAPILERAAQAIAANPSLKIDLAIWHGFTPELALSILTLLLGFFLYRYLRKLHIFSDKIQRIYEWGPGSLYQRAFSGFLDGAKVFISYIQNGYLRSYIVTIVLVFCGLLFYAMWRHAPHIDLGARLDLLREVRVYELVVLVLVISALIYLLGTRSRLTSIVVMGLVGYSAALFYILFGAPDVAATQLLIETLTVVIFVLLLHKLPAFKYLSHQFKKFKFIVVSVTFGALMTYVMLLVQEHAVPSELKEFYGQKSYVEAHGRNIVNVILVDFRALDTLGEITVLAVAALGIFALLRVNPEKKQKP
ncbi:MAG: DUF4040 domain-containing protein [Hymenobacteraceae bacterium]|nr:DUF4040 domain-containing protein [Hymenobacteraceae bacterium]MDX5482956.1 DUF4040 domain-containing protein [Hymenobacteraceae bacterium]